jgi:hypothetical protein
MREDMDMTMIRNMGLVCASAVLLPTLWLGGPRAPLAEDTVGCTAAQGAQLIAPSEQLGLCVLTASVSDLVDAIQDPATLVPAIIGACLQYGEATAAQILAVIEEEFASAPAVDSGIALSSVQAGRLKKVRDAAAAMAAKGGGK